MCRRWDLASILLLGQQPDEESKRRSFRFWGLFRRVAGIV